MYKPLLKLLKALTLSTSQKGIGAQQDSDSTLRAGAILQKALIRLQEEGKT